MFMKSSLFFLFFFYTSLSLGQYFPRGMGYNDNYLPDFDATDKTIVGIDGMFDIQKEDNSASSTSTTYQVTRGHLNIMYGGQVLRGGLQVIQETNRDIKDLSFGLGLTYSRPLFFEASIASLQRTVGAQSFSGMSYNTKVGYYYNLIMHIKYRFRIRLALSVNYKSISAPVGESNVLQFYPLLGLEFET